MTNRQHPAPPDTVVVGAGLPGPACALGLSEAGLRVELLEASDERCPPSSPTGCRAAREVLADRAAARTART
jgi:2-polyprenyl-6-methoxyphenol hydroxylase-like FAD-dependent oxidoreductase